MKLFKQLFCKHDWQGMLITIDTEKTKEIAIGNYVRCVKCKKHTANMPIKYIISKLKESIKQL